MLNREQEQQRGRNTANRRGSSATDRQNRDHNHSATDRQNRNHNNPATDRQNRNRNNSDAGHQARAKRDAADRRQAHIRQHRSDNRSNKVAAGPIDQAIHSHTHTRSHNGKPPETLKTGRTKGEWMDVRLPDALAREPLHAIVQYLPLPAKMAARMIRSKDLHVQGRQLRLRLFRREQPDFPPDWMDLNILYEDDFTLVIGKPAGIEVHPSEQGQRRTLAHGVAAYYEVSGQQKRVRHIHRIDKETTGPVLYAKNEFAHYQFDQAMREKRIERVYLALAEGVLMQNKGTIDKPIGQDRHHPTRRRVSETGDAAVTHYEVVERFADHTLVRLRLETGRTHQIRVHLSAIGHPLAGDGMYGGKRKLMSRQALHGEKLIWPHPWSGGKQQVHAPLPDDLAQALETLRRQRP